MFFLVPASRLPALEPNYSHTSFEAMVGGASSPVAPKASVARPVKPQAYLKKAPSRIASIGPRQSDGQLHQRPSAPVTTRVHKPSSVPEAKQASAPTVAGRTARVPKGSSTASGLTRTSMMVQSPAVSGTTSVAPKPARPGVKAKAMLCVDCASNQVRLAENTATPLPIASLTKLVTAMIVIDEMDQDKVLQVPVDIKGVERHIVGIKPGDLLSVKDLLYGLLVSSGNDCAEVLARAYPKGGRKGFVVAMNRRAKEIGATNTVLHSPSGLDTKVEGEVESAIEPTAKVYNTASAEDVALIARHAFTYPLITKISGTKTYTMRTRNPKPKDYRIASNDKLLHRGLPIAGAKTGYTDAAGKCIVALFKDQKKEHLVVLLNTPRHFNAAERIYRWASKNF